MKLYLLIFLFFSSIILGQDKIVFSKSDIICEMLVGDTLINPLFYGYHPQISPNGKYISATAYIPTELAPKRLIFIYDFKKKSVSFIDTVTSKYSDNPLWNYSSSKIAFNIMIDDKWHIGVFNTKNKSNKIITNGLEIEKIHLESWHPTKETLLLSNLKNLYEIDLNSNILNKWEIKRIVGNDASISSSMKFKYYEDKLYFIFSDKTKKLSKIFGYRSFIYSYDFKAKSLSKISPEEILVVNDFFFDHDKIIFSGFSDYFYDEERDQYYPIRNIYSYDQKRKKLKVLVREASNPSQSFLNN